MPWILSTIGGLLFTTVVLVLGLSANGGLDANDMDVIRTYLGAVIPMAAAVLALYKATGTEANLKNGLVSKKVTDALKDPTSPVAQAVTEHINHLLNPPPVEPVQVVVNRAPRKRAPRKAATPAATTEGTHNGR